MLTTGSFLGWLLLLWLGFCIVNTFRRRSKGLLKLGLKEWLRGFVFIFGFIWLMLLFMLGIFLVVPLVEFMDRFVLSDWLKFSVPWAYLWGIIASFSYGLVKLWSWKPKYTELEEAILLEERIQHKKRLGWFGRFIRIKEEDGNSSTTTSIPKE